MTKETKRKKTSASQKHTVKSNQYSTDGEKVVWRFDMVDKTGEFAFDINRVAFQHKKFIEKLLEYSNMTWSEVKKQTHDQAKSKHHLLSLESLSKEALERFKARELDEYSDSVFSFALDNKLRLVGIRKNKNFHILWYDPEHKVCPSNKKNT